MSDFPPSPPAASGPATRLALIDATALAAHLGITVAQVQRKTRDGLLPHVRLGHRTVRYNLDAVLAALAAPPPPKPLRRAAAPRPAHAAASVQDLPAYDWSASMPAGATLPSADRRG